jgi:hypothetical protein
MHVIEALQPLYSATGFAVGFLVGVTGVGGGSLMTPLLILLFGIHPGTAVGTDLLYAAMTKTAGSAVHGFNRTVDWRIVGLLGAGSVPTTALTIYALAHIGIDSAAARDLITALLAAALFFSALTLVFRRQILARYAVLFERLTPAQVDRLTVMLGAVLGALVSVTSVGAGAIGVTALLLLYPKLQTARLVGSDIAHAVPLTLVAGIGHWFLGSIDGSVLVSLLAGSVPGIMIGSLVAVRLPEPALRLILAVTLVAVATKLSFGIGASPPKVVAAEISAPR